jgi:hypothetical protein
MMFSEEDWGDVYSGVREEHVIVVPLLGVHACLSR